MARLASRAVAGYFPTPPQLVPRIARLVEVPRPSQLLVLDPCAGDGAAVAELTTALLAERSAHPFSEHCLGVEMETHRARHLRRRLGPERAHRGDAFTFAFHGPGASVLYLNSPYDDDRETGRVEHRFLVRFTEALAPGGVLLYVIPHRTLAVSADHLAAHFADVAVFRFPDSEFDAFRQLVVVGRRRAAPLPADPAVADRLRTAGVDDLAILPEGGPPAVTVRTSSPHLVLRHQAVDLAAVVDALEPFRADAALLGFDVDAAALLGTPTQVALPPRPAHIALALGADVFNGRTVHPNADGPPGLPAIVLKGRLTRRLVQVERRFDKEGKPVSDLCVERPVLDVRALRLDTLEFLTVPLGTEPSGAIHLARMNTADLLAAYSYDLARVLREQLPSLHDPNDLAQRFSLDALHRPPYRVQATAIRAGLILAAHGRPVQALAEVGTGKTTVSLSFADLLSPRNLPATRTALAGAGFPVDRLHAVRTTLVVCPPHLVPGWVEEIAAVLPGRRVQVIDRPSDVDPDRPAEFYLLSRERAKLGSRVAGVGGRTCPDCAHPLPDTRKARAKHRLRCTVELPRPANLPARLLRDLALVLYPALSSDSLARVAPFLAPHPAVHRLVRQRLDRDTPPVALSRHQRVALRLALASLEQDLSDALLHEPQEPRLWDRVTAAGRLAALLGTYDAFAELCLACGQRREYQLGDRAFGKVLADRLIEGRSTDARAVAHAADPAEVARTLLHQVLGALLGYAEWTEEPACGGALFWSTARPRRYPLARYILRRHRHLFDLVILDEAHEFGNLGSAQQRAAHRLVDLPGAYVVTLTGSLMGGYASSLFANYWALDPRFRERYDRDDRPRFAREFGFQKVLTEPYDDDAPTRQRSFGQQTDATDDDRKPLRAVGEAPGVHPELVLRTVLSTAVTMHKADLDDELPPLEHRPVLVEPDADDDLDRQLLQAFARLLGQVKSQIESDRQTERAGLLMGAMSQLPYYLDLAAEDCGPYEVRYPEATGGAHVATGRPFPATWRSPKERWLVAELRRQLDRGRRVLVYLHNTGNTGFVARLQRLVAEELDVRSEFLDAGRVGTARRKRWLDEVIRDGCRVLFVQPRAVQTGLNNLTAFSVAIWYQGPEYDARVVRQANGRVHRIGQTRPVEILYAVYKDTLQQVALDLVAAKITASEQVDGLSIAAALEAAGAGDDLDHAQAALAIGQALYAAGGGSRRRAA